MERKLWGGCEYLREKETWYMKCYKYLGKVILGLCISFVCKNVWECIGENGILTNTICCLTTRGDHNKPKEK